MKALVTYFTRKGRTKKMAEAIASSLIKYNVSFYPIIFKGGIKKLIDLDKGDLSRIENLLQEIDVNKFDLVIIGMPTYGSKPPGAFIEIINRMTGLTNSKIVLFASALGNGLPTIEIMKSLLSERGAKIIAEEHFAGFKLDVNKAIEFGKLINDL